MTKSNNMRQFVPSFRVFMEFLYIGDLIDKYMPETEKKSNAGRKKDFTKEAIIKFRLLSLFLGKDTTEMIEHAKLYPKYSYSCGMGGKVPSSPLISKTIHEIPLEMFQELFARLIKQLTDAGVILGSALVVDSTGIKAQKTSEDAKIGYTSGLGWIKGYKLHLVVDGECELPVGIILTPANVSDTVMLEELLKTAKMILKNGFSFVIADKGYDSKNNNDLVVNSFDAIPVIAIRKNSKPAKRFKTAKDKKQTKLTKFGFKCPRMKDYVAGGGGPNYREHPPIRRGSRTWVRYFNKRSAVERVISRLRDGLGLSSFRPKNILGACKLALASVICMLLVALVSFWMGRGDLIRSIKKFRWEMEFCDLDASPGFIWS